MARVDFYVVASGGSEGAARVACKVVEKAWQRGFRVYVHTASEGEARHLDELLWTFRQDSFVPHALAGSEDDDNPVTIGCDLRQGAGRDVLVNLCAPIPAAGDGFERIAEVVSDDAGVRTAARERYAAYRQSGHELQHHDVQP